MTKGQQPDPCQKQACRIQDCLQKNHYQEAKCLKVIEDLQECCRKFSAKSPTVCCEGIHPGNGDPVVRGYHV